MADDITYTSSSPAGPPDATKQATDEHATRGHMPLVKIAYSANGDATQVTADADGLLVNLGTNNDVTVTSGNIIVDSMPASKATATEAFPEYTEAQSAALSQDLEGNLRTRVSAEVSESQPTYIDGEVRSPSLDTAGRLRVSVVVAAEYMEFFSPFDFGTPADIWALSNSPWRALQ